MEFQEMISDIRKKLAFNEKEITDASVMDAIEDYVLHNLQMTMKHPNESRKLIERIFCSMRRELDILQPYIEDEKVSEIMVNGIDDIFIEKGGSLKKVDTHFDSVEQLEDLIRRIAAKVHRELNELNPKVDARLEDG